MAEDWRTNEWVNDWKFTCSYGTVGNILTELDEFWLSNSWVNEWNYICTYDANGNMQTWKTELWNANLWVNDSRGTLTYDSDGNKQTEIVELWQYNAWENYSRYTYTYDANGNSITGKYDKWESAAWDPGMGFPSLYSQKHFMSYLSSIYRYEASYTSFINGITETTYADKSLNFCPNPASEKIIIETSGPINDVTGSIFICGTDGRALIEQRVRGTRMEMDISSLPDGLYLVRLTNGERARFGKFIKN